jgi:hypothetical protein
MKHARLAMVCARGMLSKTPVKGRKWMALVSQPLVAADEIRCHPEIDAPQPTEVVLIHGTMRVYLPATFFFFNADFEDVDVTLKR